MIETMYKPPVNPVQLDLRLSPVKQNPEWKPLPAAHPSAQVTDQLLNPREASAWVAALDRNRWIPVGYNGIKEDYRPSDPVGSWRMSSMDETLAGDLWQRLCRAVPSYPGHRAVGLNPLLRFIRYRSDGLLVPHYDGPFHYPDGKRVTLVTLVLYLEYSGLISGGATRFIADPQRHLPAEQKDYSDWPRLAREDEVIASVAPAPGRALMFEHRVLHDSEAVSGEGQKTILRTDVVYERV